MRGEIMEISNKTLVWLVVATIVVSIFGTIVSVKTLKDNGLTAYATSNTTGNATVSISTQTILSFVINTLNFGAGTVNTSHPAHNCTLENNGTTIVQGMTGSCINFNSGAGYPSLTLENAGNTFMNVSINFTTDASGFPGGNATVRSFAYTFRANESGSCIGATTQAGWIEVASPATMKLICSNLSWFGADSMLVGLKVVIPEDADGTKNVTIVAQGTSL